MQISWYARFIVLLAFTDLNILFLIQSLLCSAVSCTVTPARPAQRSHVAYGM